MKHPESDIRHPTSEMDHVLGTQELAKRYGRRRVVDGVSIEVAEGEVVGLLGPNGAGKTTTFYMIVGIVKPDAGQIVLDDRDITMLPMYKRARKGIGYLSQDPSIFQKLTVAENVMAILETQRLSKEERQDRLSALLDDLGVTSLAKQKAYRLSGGEQRRVEIARVLVTQPRFILLDEPFTGIDPKTIEDIQGIVARLKERGIGVLITDHNVRETLEITDRAYIMFHGNILKAGTARALAEDRETRELYLGERFRLD